MSSEQKEALAKSAATSSGYLRQVFVYNRSTGATMARVLAEETGIGAHEFCPDAFSPDDVLSLNLKKA